MTPEANNLVIVDIVRIFTLSEDVCRRFEGFEGTELPRLFLVLCWSNLAKDSSI
jgi:hypothetical protein